MLRASLWPSPYCGPFYALRNRVSRRELEIFQSALDYARPLDQVRDLDTVIDRIKDAKVVMLGEATHGTQEFYEWRRLISEWLIVKHGFNFIAVEGDWPACHSLDEYARGHDGNSARESLVKFRRWPTWMWSNTEVLRLSEWMRSHNSRLQPDEHVGFHGIDVYSFFESMNEVVAQLEKLNPFLARRAKNRYACFNPYKMDEKAYLRSLFEAPAGCETEVLETLQELLQIRMKEISKFTLFDVQQNARIVKNAERYYRAMIHADDHSWNVRDTHMMETLDQLLQHYSKSGQQAKGIVWAHNTHIGDHHATDMVKRGMVNIGGLARQLYGPQNVALVGFGTYQGSVIASHAWDGPIETLRVPPGKSGSYEAILHSVTQSLGHSRFTMVFDRDARQGPLADMKGHRAIGVVYDPEHERWGNYVPTSLSKRYDAFIFIDETKALTPFVQPNDRRELPETWPVGQ